MKLHELLPAQLKQALEEEWPLLVPAGCVEYHGPHLPLGVDTFIVQTLLERVASQINCVIAPPFWYGPTGYAVTGPTQGTLDVSTERFGRHVKDVLGSMWDVGFRWIVIAVHHQGVDGPESLAIRQAAAELVFEKTWQERGNAWWGKAPLDVNDRVFERIQVWPSVLSAAAEMGAEIADHAGFYETSLVMAACPNLVDMDQLGMNAPWYSRVSGSKARQASADEGERLWKLMVDAWVARLAQTLHLKRPPPKDVIVSCIF